MAAHHGANVLRLKAGDSIVLFDGTGGEWFAELKEIGRKGATALLRERRERNCESPLNVILAQGISAGEKMDYTIQKAVELGVSAIQPLATRRAKVQLSGERAEKRVQHWQEVVHAACEQSGRNRVPRVGPILALDNWLGGLSGSELRLTLSPAAEPGLAQLPKPGRDVILLVGPEGGLDEEELGRAELRGFRGVRLGPRVLRTETAALAALSAMQTLWGDF
jgi:16S rRNA (uracil1498-N3)-methyltransferase